MKKIIVVAGLFALGYYAHEVDWSDVKSPVSFDGNASKDGVKVQVKPSRETVQRAEVIRKKMGY